MNLNFIEYLQLKILKPEVINGRLKKYLELKINIKQPTFDNPT